MGDTVPIVTNGHVFDGEVTGIDGTKAETMVSITLQSPKGTRQEKMITKPASELRLEVDEYKLGQYVFAFFKNVETFDELENALRQAQIFLKEHNNDDEYTSITGVEVEGAEFRLKKVNKNYTVWLMKDKKGRYGVVVKQV